MANGTGKQNLLVVDAHHMAYKDGYSNYKANILQYTYGCYTIGTTIFAIHTESADER
jgi:hypothetical protein